MLFKLNSTQDVAAVINWTKISFRKVGGIILSSSYRVSAQIWMVSAKETLVKRLEMSKEQRKDLSGFKFELSNFFCEKKGIFNAVVGIYF